LHQIQKDSEKKETNLTENRKTLEFQLKNESERLLDHTRRIRELEASLFSDKNQVQSLISVNEELRSLFEQERSAAASDNAQLQEQNEQLELTSERKLKVIKSKLTVVIGTFALDRSITSKMMRGY
jgi:hypothetical protein